MPQACLRECANCGKGHGCETGGETRLCLECNKTCPDTAKITSAPCAACAYVLYWAALADAPTHCGYFLDRKNKGEILFTQAYDVDCIGSQCEFCTKECPKIEDWALRQLAMEKALMAEQSHHQPSGTSLKIKRGGVIMNIRINGNSVTVQGVPQGQIVLACGKLIGQQNVFAIIHPEDTINKDGLLEAYAGPETQELKSIYLEDARRYGDNSLAVKTSLGNIFLPGPDSEREPLLNGEPGKIQLFSPREINILQ